MAGYIYLLLAILMEVTGTTFMKLSCGFTKVMPSCLMAVFYILSFSSLTLAVKSMEISTAYAIWSGLGTALIAVIGFLLFRETVTVFKLISMAMIVFGVVGLQLAVK